MLGPDITLEPILRVYRISTRTYHLLCVLVFFSSFFLFHVALVVVDLGSSDDLVAGGSPLRPVSSH